MRHFRSSTILLLEKTIAEYMSGDDGLPKEVAVRDILTDLRHYCELNDVDLDDRPEASLDVYLDEREDAGDD